MNLNDIPQERLKELLIYDTYAMVFQKNYTMKRYHFVENVQGHGRVYITIYIYIAIENTIKEQNKILLKLQFFCMNNKSRLYKYLLNYYDITQYGLIPP